MHTFCELVRHSTEFTLNAIRATHREATKELQTSSPTSLVKALQMVQLQKVVSSVGMFSMFDAILQEQLHCDNGFREAGKLLGAVKQAELKKRFEDFQLAINVLKHGRGRSYDELLQKADTLPFWVKPPDHAFFNEGDTAEFQTLVKVDDDFVLQCAEIIQEVAFAIKNAGRDDV